jgi:hypothetical protein
MQGRIEGERQGWSEPATTNAPVEDEAVEAVLGMNQKQILPARRYCFFPPLLCPKIFLSYLPPSHLPPPSYLRLPPPTSHLPPPSYMPPPTSHSIARAREQSSMSGRGGTFGAGTPAIVGVGAPAIVGAGVPATIVVGAELPLLELERLPLLELKCLKQDPHET